MVNRCVNEFLWGNSKMMPKCWGLGQPQARQRQRPQRLPTAIDEWDAGMDDAGTDRAGMDRPHCRVRG